MPIRRVPESSSLSIKQTKQTKIMYVILTIGNDVFKGYSIHGYISNLNFSRVRDFLGVSIETVFSNFSKVGDDWMASNLSDNRDIIAMIKKID